MNTNKNRLILYLISITIVVVIGIQLYWNYQNYQANKAELKGQIQNVLNGAIDEYYAKKAKTEVSSWLFSGPDSLAHTSAFSIGGTMASDSIFVLDTDSIAAFRMLNSDTSFSIKDSGRMRSYHREFKIEQEEMVHAFSLDSGSSIKDLASKIVVSIVQDSMDIGFLTGILQKKFAKQEWPITYTVKIVDSHALRLRVPNDSTHTSLKTSHKDTDLMVRSNSEYLPPFLEVELHYANISSVLLKKGWVGIALSLLLSGATIASLLFLMRVIQGQKQLSEMKDDLISNLTHEFKTPITTVSAALEAIENFNDPNNPDKTKKYIAISKEQLGKLNAMIEKLLDTATMEADKVVLEKVTTDLVPLCYKIIERYKLIDSNKRWLFQCKEDAIPITIDAFHFANALENIVDNAFKYGGEQISMTIEQDGKKVSITIEDNGDGVPTNSVAHLFEKFYRVPKGNQHDIKGFGIGLYYAKKIVNMHQGELQLLSQKNPTKFKIELYVG